VRKAGDPNLVDRITGFLADNALTRSWAESVDKAVITPAELMFVKEIPERKRFLVLSDHLVDDSHSLNENGKRYVSTALEQAKPENAQAVIDFISSFEGDHAAIRNRLFDVSDKANPSLYPRLLDILASRNGIVGLSDAGDIMRQLGIGSPVAAYSAVTAGGAMGTAAAIEGYKWLQQQQQQENQ